MILFYSLAKLFSEHCTESPVRNGSKWSFSEIILFEKISLRPIAGAEKDAKFIRIWRRTTQKRRCWTSSFRTRPIGPAWHAAWWTSTAVQFLKQFLTQKSGVDVPCITLLSMTWIPCTAILSCLYPCTTNSGHLYEFRPTRTARTVSF